MTETERKEAKPLTDEMLDELDHLGYGNWKIGRAAAAEIRRLREYCAEIPEEREWRELANVTRLNKKQAERMRQLTRLLNHELRLPKVRADLVDLRASHTKLLKALEQITRHPMHCPIGGRRDLGIKAIPSCQDTAAAAITEAEKLTRELDPEQEARRE